MAHDYVYGLRLDSEGSPTALSAIATNVRILPEVFAAQRARPSVLANAHGSTLEARTFHDSFASVLEVDLDYGTPEDPDTVYQNLGTLLRRANHNLERVWLTRTAPDQGAVERPFVILREPQTGFPRHRIRIPCFWLDPFWRDQAVTFNAVDSGTGITPGGSAPIGDAVLVFSGSATAQTLTHVNTGETITITGDTTVNAVTVDCGARTVVQSGSPADGLLTASTPWLLELEPAVANTFTKSDVGGTVTITARDKWF